MRKETIIHTSSALILLNILFICLTGCKNNGNYIDANNVQQVNIIFLPKGINPDAAVSTCDEIFDFPRELINDTIISNRKFISCFINEVNKLSKSKNSVNYDFRGKCTIVFRQGENKEICFGADHIIVIEGVLMEDNMLLFDILNNTLYPS